MNTQCHPGQLAVDPRNAWRATALPLKPALSPAPKPPPSPAQSLQFQPLPLQLLPASPLVSWAWLPSFWLSLSLQVEREYKYVLSNFVMLFFNLFCLKVSLWVVLSKHPEENMSQDEEEVLRKLFEQTKSHVFHFLPTVSRWSIWFP